LEEEFTHTNKNLETGEILSDKIENTGNSVWANDNKTIFYTRQDKVTLRSDKVFKHKLATDAADDVLVFNEKGRYLNVSVSKKNQIHCNWFRKY
jgi:oligopeptidase B